MIFDRKKKKKQQKDKFKRILEQEVTTGGDSSCDSLEPTTSKKLSGVESKTKAELAFEKTREQRVCFLV